jgi:glycosyltransferase involved in cell wall biosynthesis
MFIKKALEKSAALVTVSKKSKDDLTRLAQAPEGSLAAIHSGISGLFHPVEADEEVAPVKDKYNLGDTYILGFAHKNGESIIRAFKRLTPELQQQYKVGLITLNEKQARTFNRKRHSGDRDGRIIFTPPPSDRELALLYAGATLFVFPSFYEGFGFPVLEAMKCGCPVICSNRGSLPEIAGRAALYIQGLNDIKGCAQELSKKMEAVLTDEELHRDLVEKGKRQASKFKWKNTAQQYLEICEKLFRSSNDTTSLYKGDV